MKIKHEPSHYLKKIYLDTVTYNAPAVKMVLDWSAPTMSSTAGRAPAHFFEATGH